MRWLLRSGSWLGLALVLAVAAACGPLNTTPATPASTPVEGTQAQAQGAQAAQAPTAVEPAKVEPAKAKPRAPTEDEIKQLSHELLDAWDRGDVAKVEALLAPEFLHFEGGHGADREKNLNILRKRKPTTPTIESRTWTDERVRIHEDGAVFTGKATERQGGNKTKGGYKYVGWYLLEWVRRGETWQARLWTWQRAGENEMREHWNEIFRNGLGFAREPNRLLADTVKGRKPGTALDVAMGQGRNALYLASQGWKVTGVDIADEGIRMAREEAARRKLALETVNIDINQYDFGKSRWDLVTMIYATSNEAWIEKIKVGLRPGGLFIVEFFAKDPDGGGGGFVPGRLAQLFATGFDILRDEVVEDVPDWAMDRARLVRFVARKR